MSGIVCSCLLEVFLWVLEILVAFQNMQQVREMNVHGATGVGILEEQHAHYLVAAGNPGDCREMPRDAKTTKMGRCEFGKQKAARQRNVLLCQTALIIYTVNICKYMFLYIYDIYRYTYTIIYTIYGIGQAKFVTMNDLI